MSRKLDGGAGGGGCGMERWRGKVAVITGAASGIGYALAKRLCEEGLIVVGADTNEQGLKKLADECSAAKHNTFHPFTVDLRSEQSILQLFQFVERDIGRGLDILVNNAGVARLTPVHNASSEAVRTLYDVNVIAPILCTREALRIMFARNPTNASGYIMFTNSISGERLLEDDPNDPESVLSGTLHLYESTKHAMKVVREGLRRELRARGSRIRVGEVSPASVQTDITLSFIPSDMQDKEKIRKIQEKMRASNTGIECLSAEDIADAFVYMLQAPERVDISNILIQNNVL